MICWGFAAIGVVLSTVLSQELVGVNYSFDVDFERTFNNKTCATDERWLLVDYTSLRISAPTQNSRKGIRSKESSCTSSFPIVFFKNSLLELNIYLDLVKEKSGLVTTIYDEHGAAIATYAYNKSDKFRPGWNTYSIEINTNVTGYINLIGHSQDNEVILVDSLRYITSTNRRQNHIKTSNDFEIYQADDALLEDKHESFDLLFDNEGSGDKLEGSGEDWDELIGEDIEDEDDIDEKGVTKIEE